MARTTVQMCDGVLAQLCKQMGKNHALYGRKFSAQIGDWFLDYAPEYGGVRVHELGEHYSESFPLINSRLTPAVMYESLRIALYCVVMFKREHGMEDC